VAKGKRVVDARNASDGTVSHVKLSGNSSWTSVDTAMRMADRGDIENAHSVHRTNAKPHLRTNPDGRKGNNLDTLAED
jgi:hypothetical protein